MLWLGSWTPFYTPSKPKRLCKFSCLARCSEHKYSEEKTTRRLCAEFKANNPVEIQNGAVTAPVFIHQAANNVVYGNHDQHKSVVSVSLFLPTIPFINPIFLVGITLANTDCRRVYLWLLFFFFMSILYQTRTQFDSCCSPRQLPPHPLFL